MLKEEWRMHSEVFGSKRFALFPAVIFIVSFLVFYFMNFLRFSIYDIQLGMHFLVLFFGLNVGGIGFVSRSGIKNVLGEMNLLIFSSRTLPVGKVRILLTFLVKDIIYYFAFFILPLNLGFLAFSPSPAAFLLSLVSYTLAFLLGISITFIISVAYSRLSKLVFGLLVVFIGLSAFYTPFSLLNLNIAFLFYLRPSIELFSFALVVPLLLFWFCSVFFGYEKHTRPKKRADIYQKLKKAGIIEAKNLVDLQRSSGGFFKVIFSFGMLFAVFYFMLELFPVFNLFLRTPVMVLGILLGMASLSVYNWLNRFDSKEDYLFLPLTEEELLRSKVRSFYILVVPIILLVETAAFILLNSSLLGLFHGIVAGLVSSSYILAVAVTLTGMKPNTMLFDSGKLVKFVFYSSLLFVPLLILSISIVSSPIYSSVFALALYTAGAVVVWKEVFRRLG